MKNLFLMHAKSLVASVRRRPVTFFHDFRKPPYGGANQFMIALEKSITKSSVAIEHNSFWRGTRAAILNGFLFNIDQVRRLRRINPTVRIVHRLTGPVGVYRGTDIEIDRQTKFANDEFADATIFISDYSAEKYREIGLTFKNPVVIRNASDPDIFYPRTDIDYPAGNRKVRIIATAWSDNPKKGGPLLHWLSEHLDPLRYELTFVGRTKVELKNVRCIDAVPSEQLADILRQHDIYIAPSQDDPCSNALVEALSCGLPAVYLNSGGHPELVGDGGYPFTGTTDVLAALNAVASDIPKYRRGIHLSPIQEVARRYMEILGLSQ